MRVLIVVNPVSGGGGTRSRVRRLAAALGVRGASVETVFTEGPGHAARLVGAEDSPAVVIAVGGDGTVHDVLQGLDPARQRLGVLPAGTGNDFVWGLGWDSSAAGLLARWEAGVTRRVDLGRWRVRTAGGVGEGRFHNSVGLGFEALVNARSHRMRRWPKRLRYAAALALSLPAYRSYDIRVARDGGPPVPGKVALCSVCNGPRVGGRFRLAPAARLDDGRLDLVTVEGMGLWSALRLLPGTLGGTHADDPRVRVEPVERLELRAPGGIPVYVDGEFVHAEVQALEIEVLPAALSVF